MACRRLTGKHVLPVLLRRFRDATLEGRPEVVVWGTGAPLREFMHVEDCADALVFLLKAYSGADPINVGTGRDVSIGELARLIAEAAGFKGRIVFDPALPDGTPRKLLDVSRLKALGWQATIELEDGIESTYRWLDRELNRGKLPRGHSASRESVAG